MKSIWILFAFLGFFLQGVFIFVGGKGLKNLELAAKGLASVCFVIVGIIALRYTAAPAYGWLVVLGLAFGAVGDILLQLGDLSQPGTKLHFLLGTASFLVGHLLYIAAILTRGGLFLAWSIPLAAAACLLLIPIVRKWIRAPKDIENFGSCYMAVLIVTAVFAFGQMFTGMGHLGSYLLALGTASFAFSDHVLVLNAFGRPLPAARLVNLSSYYLGQTLIALSIFCIA